jgi:hypothetical protein
MSLEPVIELLRLHDKHRRKLDLLRIVELGVLLLVRY